jgi:hypothetical protein
MEIKKLIPLVVALILTVSSSAQAIEGDALLSIIGSKVNDAATQKFFNEYGIKNTSGGKYSSEKNGIDVTTLNDSLTSMTIYRSNSIYGNYTKKLPKGIAFGNSSGDIVKLLGKPKTTYTNSGYSEYEYGLRIMACWFEDKVLNQVLITLK